MAREMTKKQKAFAAGVAAGVDRVDAALAAGYTKATAANAACQLMNRADIQNEIARLKGGGKKGKPEVGADDEKHESYLKDNYKDPLSLMIDVMNNPRAPASLRYAAAKDALPYCHGRIGEKGKKETEKEAAKKKANTGRFSGVKRPSHLRAVN